MNNSRALIPNWHREKGDQTSCPDKIDWAILNKMNKIKIRDLGMVGYVSNRGD